MTALSDIEARLDAHFSALARSDGPGLVVGVAQHGRVLCRRGFGMANLEFGIANTPATRMRIGSTSKHFTCLAALLLAEDGQLDLDESIRTYVPELPALGQDPTLRQLMQHVGGLRCYLDLAFLSSGLAIQPPGAPLALTTRQAAVNSPPGERFLYCNGGYHLISLAIERRSRVRFEDFLARRIFEPLGMVDTVSAPSDLAIVSRLATLHIPQPDGGYRRGIFPTEEFRGEGAMVSTVDDMLRWLAQLRGPQRSIGSAASWAQLLQPQTLLRNGSSVPYGLGLFHTTHRGVAITWHSGGVVGGTAQMLTVPQHELDVIVMMNGLTKPSAVEAALAVVDIVLGESALRPKVAPAPSEAHRALWGMHFHSPTTGMLLALTDGEGALSAKVLNNAPIPLMASEGSFELPFNALASGPYQVALAADAEAPPDVLSFSEGGNADTLFRLPNTPPAAADIRGLVGRYRCPDLDARATIAVDGEAFVLAIQGTAGRWTMRLRPLSGDVFACASSVTPTVSYQGCLDVVRSADGVVASLRLTTLRTRHLMFTREDAEPFAPVPAGCVG